MFAYLFGWVIIFDSPPGTAKAWTLPSLALALNFFRGLLMLTRRQRWDAIFLSGLSLPEYTVYFGLEGFVLVGSGR